MSSSSEQVLTASYSERESSAIVIERKVMVARTNV